MINFIHLKEVGSTNSYLLENEYPLWTVLTTDHQTAGKGRGAHVWESGVAEDITMSIMLPLIDTDRLFGLQIVLAYAIVDTLNKYVTCKVKWPNDIVSNGKKLAGMLLETRFSGTGLNKLVFGAGINVNSKILPENAISISLITGNHIDMETLKHEIADNIFYKYTQYYNNALIITNEWEKYSAFYNKQITFHRNGIKYTAIEKGITKNGYIIIENIDKTEEIVSEMEIGYDFSF